MRRSTLYALIVLIVLVVGGFFLVWTLTHRAREVKPLITSVTPSVIDRSILEQTQGTVRIFGERFAIGAAVKFGVFPSLQTTVLTKKELQARVPFDAMEPGWYDVAVTNPDGSFGILEQGLAVRDEKGIVPKVFYTIRHLGDESIGRAAGGQAGQLAPEIPTATIRDGVMVSAGERPDSDDYAVELGAKWVRTNHDIERNAVTQNILLATQVPKFLDAGLNVLLTLSNQDDQNIDISFGTLTDWPNAGFPFLNETTYKESITTILEPLHAYLDQGRKIWVQCENEVGDASVNTENRYWRGTTDQYLLLMNACTAAVHAADARFVAVMQGFASGPLDAVLNPNDPAYDYQTDRISTLLSDAAYDAVDLHFYGCADVIDEKVAWIKGHMPAEKPWISTENSGPHPDCPGAPKWQDDLAAFEAEQATEVTTRMTACAAAGGTVCLWFSLFDLDNESDGFNHLGLLDKDDADPLNNLPRKKPAFDTLKAYTALNTNLAPVLGPLGDQTATAGTLLTFSVTATDADSNPLTYAASNLPAGASFAQNVFSWTPTETQIRSYPAVRFSATDGDLSDEEEITITVNRVNHAPTLSTLPPQTIRVGETLSVALTATDPDGDALTFALVNPPAGMSLVNGVHGTATIPWTPTAQQTGTTSVTVTVSDALATTSAVVAITVQAAESSGGNTNTSPPAEESPPATNTNSAVNTNTTIPSPSPETAEQPLPEPTPITPPAVGGAFPESRSFVAYSEHLKGGYTVAAGNVWSDARAEIITGTGAGLAPHVRIFSNDGTLRGQFYAFPRSFRGGVRVAACDLNGDGRAEILAAPGTGRLPHVRIFTASGRQVLAKQILVLDGRFSHGVEIACADLDSDGKAEIIAAASQGGGMITVHRSDGTRVGQFFPFGKRYRGGLFVATGDVNADQTDDILVSQKAGSPEVRAFAANGKRKRGTFKPFGTKHKTGIATASGDLDGDGRERIVFAAPGGGTPTIAVYAADTRIRLSSFLAYPRTFTDGVRVAVGDVDGDGADDLVTIPTGRSAATVKMFTPSGHEL